MDRLKISKDSDLRGHVQRVLRGLRHLQLPGVPAELPQQPVPQPGADAGGAAAAAAPAAAVLLPAVANGRVSGGHVTVSDLLTTWGRSLTRSVLCLCQGAAVQVQAGSPPVHRGAARHHGDGPVGAPSVTTVMCGGYDTVASQRALSAGSVSCVAFMTKPTSASETRGPTW